ncbi:penicillin acylase family protein [Vibrio europaeus]|uniref:penicillin acylase family protein n=1 Tax=Vibrio europaeus TaxID=300876 RepID=UPI0018A7D415|nr:penicillin acylase family protein [Vibrio europaeus]MDC5809108.1 penicillin acylase family protein [Vibrio europaeus]QPG38112.1 penicillin acylase family protein [Vibrio europaeus]
MKRLDKPSASVYFVLILLVPAILVAAFLYVTFRWDLPQANHTSQLQYDQQTITVHRDGYSIPDIQANTELAVYFGLGAMHAQDRLWQMEVNRRRAAGTLSAVMGKSTLKSDQLMRTLGLKQNAQRMWQQLPNDQKQLLDAYTQGINYAMAQLTTLPIEFTIFDLTPQPWQPIDSMLLMQLMTWDLASNMESEITRSALLKNFGLDKTNEVMKPLVLDGVSNLTAAMDSSRLGPYFFNREATGSNGWVISGQYTASGQPLLANDLHLPNSIPSIWYLARMKGGNLEVSGATFPGLPFVVIGRNANIAWGITNMMADTQDIYFERINPSNRNQYFYDGAWYDMTLSEEKIDVKTEPLKPQEDPITLQVRRTRNGVILSDLDPRLKGVSFSLKWTADVQNGGTFASFNRLNYAKNWPEFKQALRDYVAPVQNFLYADRDGNIGYLVPGMIPKRKPYDGMLPKQGWRAETQWPDWIEFDALPQQLNPEQGYIIAANNQFIDPEYPYFITGDWSDDFRAQTIETKLMRALQSPDGVDINDMKQWQNDVSSPGAVNNVALLLNQLTPGQASPDLLARLTNWNGEMARESVAATIYTAWLYQMNRLMVADDLTRAPIPANERQYLNVLTQKLDLAFVSNTLNNTTSQWCDFVMIEPTQSCNAIVNSAFDHAINALSARYGNDPDNWRWGAVHQAQYPHFPFSKPERSATGISYFNGMLSTFFHRSIAASGGEQTLNVSPSSFRTDAWFMPFYGTSYRQVIDFGDDTQDAFINTTGQSGNVFSPHYDDMITKHQNGDYIPMSESKALHHQRSDGGNL